MTDAKPTGSNESDKAGAKRPRRAVKRSRKTPGRALAIAAPVEVPQVRPVGTPPRARGDGDANDLFRYWQVVRDRWRTILGVFAVVFVAVGIGTLLQRPVYRATGTIEIRRPTAEVVPAEALFQSERISREYLETQYGVLRSPALARRVVHALGLAEITEFEPRGGLSSPTTDEEIEHVVARVQDRLRIDPVTGSYLVRVSFESRDPQLAARVVNATFESYVATREEAGRAVMARISEQADSVRTKLAESEQRLQKFVRANGLFYLKTGAGDLESVIHERTRHLEQQLTEAEAERYRRQALYDLVLSRGGDYLSSNVVQSLSVRISDLRSEYARLRSTFTDEYPRTRQVRNQLNELEAEQKRERDRIATEMRSDYMAALRRQELVRESLAAQQRQVDALSARMAEYRLLERDVAGHQQLDAVLQQKRREAEVSSALAATEVGIVDPAVPPQSPDSPSPGRNLKLAAIVGLLLGIGLAFLREHTDTAVKTVEEANSLAVPVLGTIPSVGSLERRQGLRPINARALLSSMARVSVVRGRAHWYRIDREGRPNTVLAEAFGGLRTSVLLDAAGGSPRSLLVTSSLPGEGKTTVASNLALSLTRLGKRVLLIDADLRRPSVHRAFGIEGAAGLADYLAGEADWRALLRRDVAPGLDLLPAGRTPDHPLELLSSERMRELVSEAEAGYDFAIIDSPALFINEADARILAPLTAGAVLVIRSGATSKSIVQRVSKLAPNLIGVVLNDLDIRQFPAYYRGYGVSESAERVQAPDGVLV